MKSHEQVASQKETASTPLTNWRCFACTNTRKGTAVIVSQVNTSLIRRILDKGNCQKELDHDNRAQTLLAVRSSLSLRIVEFSFQPNRPNFWRLWPRRSQLARANSSTFMRMAVFILRTHYPSGRTWANILQFVWLCVYSIKTGIKRIMRPDELPFVALRLRRIWKEGSSRRIMRLVPVFKLKTHNQTNYKCLPKFVKTDNASSSIKTDNKRLPAFYMRTNEPKHSMYKSQPNL